MMPVSLTRSGAPDGFAISPSQRSASFDHHVWIDVKSSAR